MSEGSQGLDRVPAEPDASAESAGSTPSPGEARDLTSGPEASAAAASKSGSDLRLRLLTAAILVPLVIYFIYLGGLPYLAAVVGIILLGQWEIYGLLRDKGAHPSVGFGLSAGAALPVVAYLGNEYHATVILTVTLLAVMVLELRKAQITEAMASISGTFFGVFYVGWLMSHAIVLRNFEEAVTAREGAAAVAQLGIVPESGIFVVILTLFVVVMCDAGAYFAGRAYGRRKLAPAISPAKSVEGAVGGILTGIVAGVVAKLACDLFWPDASSFLTLSAVLTFSFVLSVIGIIGDLVESLLKRDAQVKDAGWILPGMGGVLDRIDSPLLAIPVMYYLLLTYVFMRAG